MFLRGRDMIVWLLPSRLPKFTEYRFDYWPSAWEPGLRVKFCLEEECPAEVFDWIADGCTFVAHNAEQFDAVAWERLVPGPQPTWYDTIHTTRAAGLPAGLDAASLAIGIPGKDEQGKEALKLLYTAKYRGGEPVYPRGTQHLWAALVRYNIGDVLSLRELYNETVPFREPRVLDAHCTINARGIPFDMGLVAELARLWTEAKGEAIEKVSEATDGEIDGTNIGSPQQVKAWLAAEGITLSSISRPLIEAMINDPNSVFGDTDDPKVCKAGAMLQARLQAVRATAGKMNRVLTAADDDGRMRGWEVYHGAHTGRFSARIVQPHNFPRGGKTDVHSLLAAWHARGRLSLSDIRANTGEETGDALATMARPCIAAGPGKTLVVIDYAAVEARGLAWIARDDDMLDTFRDPSKCVYCGMASKIYGREVIKGTHKAERQVGKVIVLGCGYQMGVNRFGAYCKLSGVDLNAAGLTPEDCVAAYRNGNPLIPQLWKNLHNTACIAVRGGRDVTAGRCWFRRRGTWLEIKLPSGRLMRYRNARIEPHVPVWGGPPVPALVYDSPHGITKSLYGGLLAENIVQGLCRDLLVDAMCEIPNIVLAVHDEIVIEADEDAAADVMQSAATTMSFGPAWAAGFPIRVEGFISKHYVKSPAEDALRVDAMGGIIL